MACQMNEPPHNSSMQSYTSAHATSGPIYHSSLNKDTTQSIPERTLSDRKFETLLGRDKVKNIQASDHGNDYAAMAELLSQELSISLSAKEIRFYILRKAIFQNMNKPQGRELRDPLFSFLSDFLHFSNGFVNPVTNDVDDIIQSAKEVYHHTFPDKVNEPVTLGHLADLLEERKLDRLITATPDIGIKKLANKLASRPLCQTKHKDIKKQFIEIDEQFPSYVTSLKRKREADLSLDSKSHKRPHVTNDSYVAESDAKAMRESLTNFIEQMKEYAFEKSVSDNKIHVAQCLDEFQAKRLRESGIQPLEGAKRNSVRRVINDHINTHEFISRVRAANNPEC
jgi:hypothetical protein